MTRVWTVGEIIRVPANSGGFRVWRVRSVKLGAEHQESVIGLETLDRNAASTLPMYVPEELLNAALGAVVEES